MLGAPGGASVCAQPSLAPRWLCLRRWLVNLAVMQSKATTVRQYLAELPAHRRAAIKIVRAVILKNLDPVF